VAAELETRRNRALACTAEIETRIVAHDAAAPIQGIHPLPEGPWLFACSELGHPGAQQLAHRARQNSKYPTGSHPDQQNLST
jgi:hypothetical protein